MKRGLGSCSRHWLALGLGLGVLLGCGPEPVDGEPFVDPSRGPVYTPPSGTGGGANADSNDSDTRDSADDSAESSTTLKDAQSKPVCCRLCLQGKACGDSCIASELTCQSAPGCACDG